MPCWSSGANKYFFFPYLQHSRMPAHELKLERVDIWVWLCLCLDVCFGLVGGGSYRIGHGFCFWQEVLGKGFHITQPGSSVATSLIDGESKPKHVLLLEIKVLHRSTLYFCLQKSASWFFLYRLYLLLIHFYVGESISTNQDSFDVSEALWVHRGDLLFTFLIYNVS